MARAVVEHGGIGFAAAGFLSRAAICCAIAPQRRIEDDSPTAGAEQREDRQYCLHRGAGVGAAGGKLSCEGTAPEWPDRVVTGDNQTRKIEREPGGLNEPGRSKEKHLTRKIKRGRSIKG